MTDTERKRVLMGKLYNKYRATAVPLTEIDALIEAYGSEREQAAFAAAAKVCRKRAEKRFEESGITEPDTGATYYAGRISDEYEARDEEDNKCADAIERLAERE